MNLSEITSRLRDLEAQRVSEARWSTSLVRELVDELHHAQSDVAKLAMRALPAAQPVVNVDPVTNQHVDGGSFRR